ncbi:MAG: hypothetical protein H6Q90_5549 [Deltaproteobacteria bacterium]|nr:hypothetical protein [Deltaproteobacteria bacterium]
MPLDALTPDYYGWGPHKQNSNGKLEANGPFAYAGSERDANGNARGWSAGAGLLSGQLGPNGEARGDVLQAQGHFGGWRDEQGRTNVGVEGDAALARVGIPLGGALGPVGFDVEALSANAGAKFNEETASLGAQANLIAGSVSAGTAEHNARFGMSVGVGAAGRAHYGDSDGDGVRELGIGADFGPFSFDVKSELLGHAWNGISSAGSAIGNAASSAWDTVTSW